MSSTYTPPAGKRQKVRENRLAEIDYFQGIDKLEYSNMSGIDNLGYRYYSASERLQGRSMEDWMKLSVSLTHFRREASETPSYPPLHRPWHDGTNTHSSESCRRAVKACIDLCTRLGVKYITAFDTDLVPHSDSWDENRSAWEEMFEYLQDLLSRSHVKLLWLAPDLHTNPRFSSGALTSPDASTIIAATSQIKRCIEMSQRLNAECFAIWPTREKYDAIFKSDIAREMKTFAKILKMIHDYKERLSYRCHLLLLPCVDYVWERDGRYMWDVASCMCFLKNYNLERFYKVCAPHGHQMVMANAYNMLGGVVVKDYESQDTKKYALMMKTFLQQGTVPPSGINLQVRQPRHTTDLRELVVRVSRLMEQIARGLRAAVAAQTDQILAKYLQQRYLSQQSGSAVRLTAGDAALDDCDDLHKKNQHQSSDFTSSSKLEHMDLVFQRYVDGCDQM